MSLLFKKIENYCLAKWIPTVQEESVFLKQTAELLNTKSNLNSGRVSEWYISHILDNANIEYIEQPRVNYNEKSNFIKPDFYIPSKDLFIEVKSKSFNCSGTASEKIDHIPRKYSKLKNTKLYNKSKVLVVMCASELLNNSSIELLNGSENINIKSEYALDFLELSRKHNILDWISPEKINIYL